MSWFQINKSLSSIKGQLSNFANGVLAEGIVNNADDQEADESSKSEEEQSSSNPSIKDNISYNDSWLWETPTDISNAKNGLHYDLQTKIDILENEKKDLLNSLEQLDLDHRQAVEKLISMKENLQTKYIELTNDYAKLKNEYGEVLNENMEKTKQIEALRNLVDSYKNENDEPTNKNCEPQRDYNKIVDKFEETTNNYKRLIETKEILEHKIQDLEKTVTSLKDNIRLVQDNYNGAISENRDLERKLYDLNLNFEGLDRQYQEKINQIVKDGTPQDAASNLQKENDLLSVIEERNDLHKKLELLTTENEELKDQHAILQRNLENRTRNLEEVSQTFLNETKNLHEKYINIITESMKRHMDSDASVPLVVSEEHPQILEFASKVETLLKLLLDFKTKTENLEKEICQVTQEKNKVIAEKNFEIEKLLQNSEILSKEVISKSLAIKDYEDECAEFMKNNELLIIELQNLKKSGLQTISESNEDSLLLMETQLENANKKIQDMEIIISDLENLKQESSDEVQTELEYIKHQLNMTGQELSKSNADNQDLQSNNDSLKQEKNAFKIALEKIKLDYENIEYKYTEVNVGMETLREENEECKRKIAVLNTKCKKSEDLNSILENKLDLLQNIIDEQKEQLTLSEEKINEKDVLIRGYVERLQNSKMTETGFKLQVDTINKELQNVLEAKQHIEMNYNSLQSRLEEESKTEEISKLKAELKSLRDEYNNIKQMHSNVVELHRSLFEENEALESQLTEMSLSRNELIDLVTAKHEENVKYHTEIRRLNALRSENISPKELLKKNKELEKLTDQNNFLKEKCDVLTRNLLQEQSVVQKIVQEQNLASEKEQSLMKELERLRVHLVEVEEVYTQELLQAEQRNKDMQAKVNEIEQREKNSSSLYTSVSIRANQQVETLQTQLQLVSSQRDELRNKISDIEDENNKHIAAVTNLQLVLEQFQKDKEKDVLLETERIRRQIFQEKKIQDDLRNDNNNLKMQLDESKQGLQAAARLTDQLEKCKKQIINLKDEVSKLQEMLQKSESTCKALSTQNDTKVDKTLIKNLIIGYISSNANDEKQILKIIATVLDFNKKESDKVCLHKPQNAGLLHSLLHPQGVSSNSDMTQESLSTAFIKFLENESKPKVLPNLLTSKQRKVSEDASSTSSTPPPLVLSEIVLPTFVDFGKNRNSSSILKDVLKDNT